MTDQMPGDLQRALDAFRTDLSQVVVGLAEASSTLRYTADSNRATFQDMLARLDAVFRSHTRELRDISELSAARAMHSDRVLSNVVDALGPLQAASRPLLSRSSEQGSTEDRLLNAMLALLQRTLGPKVQSVAARIYEVSASRWSLGFEKDRDMGGRYLVLDVTLPVTSRQLLDGRRSAFVTALLDDLDADLRSSIVIGVHQDE